MDLHITINDQEYRLSVNPDVRLVDILREQLSLTGTKERCRKGSCGLCTVLIDGKAKRSCMMSAHQIQDAHIITIEGIGTPQNPHPLQTAFVEKGAIQCGYCTPAFIVAAYGLLKRVSKPTRDQIIRTINPILCRCTGYEQIIEAIQQASLNMRD